MVAPPDSSPPLVVPRLRPADEDDELLLCCGQQAPVAGMMWAMLAEWWHCHRLYLACDDLSAPPLPLQFRAYHSYINMTTTENKEGVRAYIVDRGRAIVVSLSNTTGAAGGNFCFVCVATVS